MIISLQAEVEGGFWLIETGGKLAKSFRQLTFQPNRRLRLFSPSPPLLPQLFLPPLPSPCLSSLLSLSLFASLRSLPSAVLCQERGYGDQSRHG